MNIHLLLDNLTNPALLFYVLGVVAARFKSDLEIPDNTSKFISIYLLFSIGFKGGQELAHSSFNMGIFWVFVLGITSTLIIPLYSFFILKKITNTPNASAISAAYGSVSAVTFVTAISFLEDFGLDFNGHMVAVMAFMEAPAIVAGALLLNIFGRNTLKSSGWTKILSHSFFNGSVFLILGCLLIGFVANEKQAMEIKPFTTDIFKGFLALFLLDKGIQSGKRITDFKSAGIPLTLFAVLVPIFNGCMMAFISCYFVDDVSDRFILAVLSASASYIAVPAAYRMIAPNANQGLYIPMALAITFPVNITIGLPLYFMISGCV